MQLDLIERPRSDWPFGAFLMLPLFGLPLGAWMVENEKIDFGVCGLKVILGIPCLSCGSTRATIRLLHGDILGALAFQPMMMSIYAILIVWGVISLGTFAVGKRVKVRLSRRDELILKVSVLAVPAANWAYLIWADI